MKDRLEIRLVGAACLIKIGRVVISTLRDLCRPLRLCGDCFYRFICRRDAEDAEIAQRDFNLRHRQKIRDQIINLLAEIGYPRVLFGEHTVFVVQPDRGSRRPDG